MQYGRDSRSDRDDAVGYVKESQATETEEEVPVTYSKVGAGSAAKPHGKRARCVYSSLGSRCFLWHGGLPKL